MLRRKHNGETLDEIAAALDVARGTVDNELKRVGVLIERFSEDSTREEILEILLGALS